MEILNEIRAYRWILLNAYSVVLLWRPEKGVIYADFNVYKNTN